jgi:hypothetical protein
VNKVIYSNNYTNLFNSLSLTTYAIENM